MTTSEYPKFFIRPEVAGCPWIEVSKGTYLRAENRWTRSRDAADLSTFGSNGVEGYVQWKPSLTEKDVIEGVH